LQIFAPPPRPCRTSPQGLVDRKCCLPLVPAPFPDPFKIIFYLIPPPPLSPSPPPPPPQPRCSPPLRMKEHLKVADEANTGWFFFSSCFCFFFFFFFYVPPPSPFLFPKARVFFSPYEINDPGFICTFPKDQFLFLLSPALPLPFYEPPGPYDHTPTQTPGESTPPFLCNFFRSPP